MRTLLIAAALIGLVTIGAPFASAHHSGVCLDEDPNADLPECVTVPVDPMGLLGVWCLGLNDSDPNPHKCH